MSPSPFSAIKAVNYTVILTRDMTAMRTFYEEILGFELSRSLSENWHEYRIGSTILTLSNPGLTAGEPQLPKGAASLQLAFEVPHAVVDLCHQALVAADTEIVSPPTDRDFGHRTLFFRDPDGNLLEIYAEI